MRCVDGVAQDLAPAVLVRLSSDELTSRTALERRRRLQEAASQLYVDESQTVSGQRCTVCGSENTKGTRRAGQRDIGKAETWGSKDRQDEHSIKSICADCGATFWS